MAFLTRSSYMLASNPRLCFFSQADDIASDPTPDQAPQEQLDEGDVSPIGSPTPVPTPPAADNAAQGQGQDGPAQGQNARMGHLAAFWVDSYNGGDKTPEPSPSVPSSPKRNVLLYSGIY